MPETLISSFFLGFELLDPSNLIRDLQIFINIMESPQYSENACSSVKDPHTHPYPGNKNTTKLEPEIGVAKDLAVSGPILVAVHSVEGTDRLDMIPTISTSEEVAPTEELGRLTLAQLEGSSQMPLTENNTNCK